MLNFKFYVGDNSKYFGWREVSGREDQFVCAPKATKRLTNKDRPTYTLLILLVDQHFGVHWRRKDDFVI